jgi:hypothetical protein
MAQSSNASASAGTSVGTTGPPVRGKTAKISVVRAHIGLGNEKYEWNKLVVSCGTSDTKGSEGATVGCSNTPLL